MRKPAAKKRKALFRRRRTIRGMWGLRCSSAENKS